MTRRKPTLSGAFLAALLLAAAPAAPAAKVVVAAGSNLPSPAEHGIQKLSEALAAAGYTVQRVPPDKLPASDLFVLAGFSSQPHVAVALKDVRTAPPRGAQALAIRRTTVQGKPAVILCGSDAPGLMYAALDAADRVSWSKDINDPFAHIGDAGESPYLAERGISIYTMQRAWFESRLHDENQWRRYFDLLARSRINTFTVIFGYENGGFMAPLYPYFFDVPAHPEVRLAGITSAQQARNTAAFRAMIRIAKERGIDVIPAVWDHIYRGGVQGGGIPGASDRVGKPTPGLVSGVTADNLAPYTKAALRQFLTVFPGIGGIEFRMHNESGLKREEMPAFWHEVFGILAKSKPGLRVTLRAKELPDSIIDDALSQGLKARIETKYWMEQMGMPFHPTHINRQNQHDRRHGYADLLTYPQRYRVHWRLWSGGTTRLLLWGDPDYVRRYAASARLYGGNSFDVNEMLATKMLGEPHDKPPFAILNPQYRHYDYEFERYWHFYQLWGRLTYSPQTPPEVWEREFERRFGAAGSSLAQGLHAASKVLPRIVAASYRYQLFPTTRGWAEMMRQGDLADYAKLEGSDIEQFQNPEDAAKSILAGVPASMRRPSDTSRWFSEIAARIDGHVRGAERAGLAGSEARATAADLRILASLARFHAARLLGAVSYNIHRINGDGTALDTALGYERAAISAWREIVAAAGDIYSSDLAFGVRQVGFPRHWKEELAKLERGYEKLAAGREPASPAPSPSELQAPQVRLEPAGIAQPGQDFVINVRAVDAPEVRSMRLRYRHLTQFEDYQSAEMSADAKTRLFTGRIPGEFIVARWDLVYFVEVIGKQGGGRNYPDLETEAPYVVVPVRR
jgi:hypothetical protein